MVLSPVSQPSKTFSTSSGRVISGRPAAFDGSAGGDSFWAPSPFSVPSIVSLAEDGASSVPQADSTRVAAAASARDSVRRFTFDSRTGQSGDRVN